MHAHAIHGGPGMCRSMRGHGSHRSRHRHGGFGYGRGAFGPGGGPYWRGRKARRGDIRTAALLLLAEEPRNGYQIMQVLEERSGGVWRPSPGSVYPALSQLEDEGFVRVEEIDGRRAYELTDAGRAYVGERGSELAATWEQMAVDSEVGSLFKEIRQ